MPVSATLNAQQVAQAKIQANAVANAATLKIPPNTFVYFVGFDGTNNDGVVNPITGLTYSNDTQTTAVKELTTVNQRI